MKRIVILVLGLAVIAGEPAASAILSPPLFVWSANNDGVASDPSEASDKLGSKMVGGDFNNDGFDDLAVGVPGEDGSAGAVLIYYGGSATGLDVSSTATAQQITQTSAGIGDDAVSFDQFGQSLAVGDFNGDTFDDLAIGVPGEDLPGPINNVGVVWVVYGTAFGLAPNDVLFPAVRFSQDSSGISSSPETNDLFGNALAAGDFNGDGTDDLAVGVDGEDVAKGAIHVLFGSTLVGISGSGSQYWTESTITSGNYSSIDTDRFGAVLEAGNFNADLYDDLVVGAPAKRLGSGMGLTGAGRAFVVYGSSIGPLVDSSVLVLDQGQPGVPGDYEINDNFGAAFAAGDFDGDGDDELAIGVPGEGVVGGPTRAGAVLVLKGSPSGLSTTGAVSWTQNSTDVPDAIESDDRFGDALVAGRFNADAWCDLAIGAPEESLTGPTVTQAGVIHVLYGTPAGLTGTGSDYFSQNSTDVPDTAEAFDWFGDALAAGDFDGNGIAEIAVASPLESVGAVSSAGIFHIFRNNGLFADGFESGTTALWSFTCDLKACE